MEKWHHKPHIKFNRFNAMPNKYTFLILPISELLRRYNVGKNWADPFCGSSILCEWRNDLDPNNKNAMYHLEAEEFAKIVPYNLNGVVFDPPYSLTQISRSYKSIGLKFKGKENPSGGFPKVKNILSKKIKVGGYVISFGWNSVGFSKKRKMKLVEIIMICHGGNHYDTIITVEKKIKCNSLFKQKSGSVLEL